jgi:hypothetical protein
MASSDDVVSLVRPSGLERGAAEDDGACTLLGPEGPDTVTFGSLLPARVIGVGRFLRSRSNTTLVVGDRPSDR